MDWFSRDACYAGWRELSAVFGVVLVSMVVGLDLRGLLWLSERDLVCG